MAVGRFAYAAAVIALAAGTRAAYAHHGVANFDLNKDVAINGAVKRSRS